MARVEFFGVCSGGCLGVCVKRRFWLTKPTKYSQKQKAIITHSLIYTYPYIHTLYIIYITYIYPHNLYLDVCLHTNRQKILTKTLVLSTHITESVVKYRYILKTTLIRWG